METGILKVVKETPVGQGGGSALDWYNAVMGTNRAQSYYKDLGHAARTFDWFPGEEIDFMNNAIDAALFICGHDFYSRASLVNAYCKASGMSSFVESALDKWLYEFIAWGLP